MFSSPFPIVTSYFPLVYVKWLQTMISFLTCVCLYFSLNVGCVCMISSKSFSRDLPFLHKPLALMVKVCSTIAATGTNMVPFMTPLKTSTMLVVALPYRKQTLNAKDHFSFFISFMYSKLSHLYKNEPFLTSTKGQSINFKCL